MAFHISIEKVSESTEEAIYTFYDTAYPAEAGEMRLDKLSGSVQMTKEARLAIFQRAAAKVTRSFTAGSLLGKLEWAS